MSSIPTGTSYSVTNPRGERVPVAQKRAEEARQIDTDGDGVCSDDELQTWMRDREILLPAPAHGNVARITEEFKAHLTGDGVATATEDGRDYRSLEQLEARMRGLAADHPDKCQVVSVARTHEGREVLALKISAGADGDTSSKPGVVFTGAHHAREWMTPEVTLGLAEDLIENYDSSADMKRRVDGAETWIIPVVNPDGFHYSQTEDNMWRKNRSPIVGSDGKLRGYGVDLNRNYWDGKPEHLPMYRADGDTPGSTYDDFGASDSPRSEAFRGLAPASEPEVQGLMALEYGRPNIRGIVDHHSYGGTLMRPWDHIPEKPENVKEYDEAAGRMLAAMGDRPYDYIQTYELYPTTGASVGCHHVNGRFGFGVEMGDSFQPPFSEFPETYQKMSGADFAFLDWVMEKFPAQAQPPAGNPPPPAEPPPSA